MKIFKSLSLVSGVFRAIRRFCRVIIVMYKIGIKNRFKIVDTIIPPKTAVPIEILLVAPTPVANTRGKSPKIQKIPLSVMTKILK